MVSFATVFKDALIVMLVFACGIFKAYSQTSLKVIKPNIIFLLTDDQGYGDFGLAGHLYIKTVNPVSLQPYIK